MFKARFLFGTLKQNKVYSVPDVYKLYPLNFVRRSAYQILIMAIIGRLCPLPFCAYRHFYEINHKQTLLTDIDRTLP